MFLHLSVILFTGGMYTPPADTHWTPPTRQNPHQADTPWGRHPLSRHPLPWADTPTPKGRPPLSRHSLPRWQLQRAACILLECILVYVIKLWIFKLHVFGQNVVPSVKLYLWYICSILKLIYNLSIYSNNKLSSAFIYVFSYRPSN